MSFLPIKSALISVYDKSQLEPIVSVLAQHGVTIYSTGGTETFIKGLGIEVISVESITGFPSILGGRVKTLHPVVFGGILSRKDLMDDLNDMAGFNIPPIDLVMVDLYPFERTLESGASHEEVIEKIDIGGVSLIRAAAKNFQYSTVVSRPNDYHLLLEILSKQNCSTTLEQRSFLAAQAFNTVSHYDTAIFHYLNREPSISAFKTSHANGHVLRYGENPHQQGVFYGNLDQVFEKLNGKELSYNNLLDVDSAIHLISDFTEPSFCVIKHNNACGMASRTNAFDAWRAALAGDPVAAFGGIIASNCTIDRTIAEDIDKIFYEVLIAPEFTEDALELLCKKKNRIVLKSRPFEIPTKQFRSLLGGVLEQDRDAVTESNNEMNVVTTHQPDQSKMEDMIFANKLVKHTKSNAIVLVKNKQLIGSGTGQTSRIEALHHAVQRAKQFNHEVHDCVLASDAFFPFADSVEMAYREGIRTIIQPGGSIKDQDSIDFCNTHGLSMVFTGYRHFKH